MKGVKDGGNHPQEKEEPKGMLKPSHVPPMRAQPRIVFEVQGTSNRGERARNRIRLFHLKHHENRCEHDPDEIMVPRIVENPFLFLMHVIRIIRIILPSAVRFYRYFIPRYERITLKINTHFH